MSDLAKESGGVVRMPNKPRGCGSLKAGGVYFYAAGSPFGTLPLAVLIDPPIPVDFGFFRGWRLIQPHAIDLRLPTITWWEGTSAVREQERAMLRADLDLFGLPWHERAGNGICAGITRRGEGRTQGVVVYRYRLPENTVLNSADRQDFLATVPDAQGGQTMPWHFLPAGQAVHDLVARNELGAALALAWRAWWPLRWRAQVDAAFYRLVFCLAGIEEARFAGSIAAQRAESPDRFLALVDKPFCQAHGIEYDEQTGQGRL